MELCKKEDCCEEFREEIRRAWAVMREELSDDWITTAKVVRGTARKVLGVSAKQERRPGDLVKVMG